MEIVPKKPLRREKGEG